jgi:DNA primase
MSSRRELAHAAARETKPRASGWWRGPCPFCPPCKTDSTFSFQPSTGHWHCFRCGTGGSLEPDDFTDTLASVSVDTGQEARQPPEGFLPLGYGDGLKAMSAAPARKYLAKRGVSADTIRRLQIGCVLGSGRYANRIVVPILAGGHWRGWVARDFTGKAAKKYLNPRGSWRSDILFDIDSIAIETDTPCLLVEGVFDALPFAGDAAAVLGKPTEDQISLLKWTARRPICVVLDGDAWEEGWTLGLRLRLEGLRAGSVRLPPKKDPDQVDPAWLLSEARESIFR